MVNVSTTVPDLSKDEVDSYLAYGQKKYPNKIISGMSIVIDGNDYVNVTYTFRTLPFQRIRRITGYLVGTTDRFNDAKKAEVKDRIVHTL